MSRMASQITGILIVCSTLSSSADQRKHQSSVWLAFVSGIHQWPVDSPHKGPVIWKMFPFDDIIMICRITQTWTCLFILLCSYVYVPILCQLFASCSLHHANKLWCCRIFFILPWRPVFQGNQIKCQHIASDKMSYCLKHNRLQQQTRKLGIFCRAPLQEN